MTILRRWLPAWVGLWLVGLLLSTPVLASSELPPGPQATAGTTQLSAVEGRRVEVPVGWHTLHGEHLRVHGPIRHMGLMEALLDHADPRVPRLAERLRHPIGAPIDVFLSTTDAEFRRVQPGEPPAWADATAYPGLGAVYLRAPQARGGDRDPLTTVLDHELVHIVVGRAFAPERAPTWLQEGLAQLHAEQYDLARIRQLSTAAISGPIALDRLEGAFPRNPHAASLAYAQSVDFLVWLEREYGEAVVPALVEELRGGATLADAILTVTGRPLHEVDAAWSSRFTGFSGAVWSIFGSPDFMWLVAAILGAAAMFIVRRRQRIRRDVIRTRERADRELLREFLDRYHRPPLERDGFRDVGDVG